MTSLPSNRTPSVLALFPNTRGVGYSFFQSHQEHHLSKMICARKRDNRIYLKRVKKLIDEFNPKVIVLEKLSNSDSAHKVGRIKELISEVKQYALQSGIEVKYYSRSQIREVFSFYNVMTKYEIAELICTWIPSLTTLLYVPRSGEQTEPYSSAVFSAVSLAIVYYYLSN